MDQPTIVPTSSHPMPRPRPGEGELQVTVVRGLITGHVVGLHAGELLVGRAEGSDLRLLDPGVSRRHALLVRSAHDTVAIIDLASTNGVFVNGTARDVATLEAGDLIAIGPHVLLRFGPGEATSATSLEWVRKLLSLRERQVAGLAAQGMNTPRISEALGIGRRTVESHLGRVYAKLGVEGRAGLVRCWLEAGLGD